MSTTSSGFTTPRSVGVRARVHVPPIDKLFEIELENTKITVKDFKSKVEEELTTFSPEMASSLSQFSLFESMEKSVLNSSPPLEDNEFLEDYEPLAFTYDKTLMSVKIRTTSNEEEKVFNFPGHFAIAKIIPDIQPVEGEYELHLLTTNNRGLLNNVGVRLNPHRTLRSYRVKPGDVLVLRKSRTNSGLWRKLAGNEQVAVIIKMPPPWNVSKTMTVPCNIKFHELTKQFLQKVYLKVPPSIFGIFVNLFDDDENGEPDLIGSNMALNSIPLAIPIQLTCKLIPQCEQKLFGVDPEHLPMVNDNGIIVPRVLVILKEMLMINNGFGVEGLFRLAGSESTMKDIKDKLEKGGEISCLDVHSIATLIKRWFKEIPTRVLVNSTIKLDTLVNLQRQKLQIQSLVSPLNARLLSWIFDLCLKVMEQQETSKMNAKNLAIVWGPAIVAESHQIESIGTYNSNASNDLKTTGYGVDLVETNLNYLFAEGISAQQQLKESLEKKDEIEIPLRTNPKQRKTTSTPTTKELSSVRSASASWKSVRPSRPESPQQTSSNSCTQRTSSFTKRESILNCTSNT